MKTSGLCDVLAGRDVEQRIGHRGCPVGTTRTCARERHRFSGDGDRRVNAARKLIRESDDPTTGDRWLLLRDSSHPGGPGRWVLSSPGPGSAGTRQPGIAPAAPSPVIRPGDRLIVEQNSALIRARLEAVALGSAVPGSILNVRLQIGGGVFRAVALGPGRAAFEPAGGIEP